MRDSTDSFLRTQTRLAALSISRRLGLLYSSLDASTSIQHCAVFYGDRPKTLRSGFAAELAIPTHARIDETQREAVANAVYCADFHGERPLRTFRKSVLYTPEGHAWADGGLDEAMSTRRVYSVRPIIKGWRQRVDQRLEQGTLIQAEHSSTYGDWASEHMKSLAQCGEILEPLLLPARLGRRPYVIAELARVGIDYVTVEEPTLISNACIVHKKRHSLFWHASDAQAYRRLFRIEPSSPRKGSVVYLSRLGVRSELAATNRTYPSEMVAEIIEQVGGRVVHTEGMSFDDFAHLGDDVETVVADHGAALFNILQWRTRNVIEIVADHWWSHCFVFLGAACGVENHALVRGATKETLRDAILGHLATFQSAANQACR